VERARVKPASGISGMRVAELLAVIRAEDQDRIARVDAVVLEQREEAIEIGVGVADLAVVERDALLPLALVSRREHLVVRRDRDVRRMDVPEVRVEEQGRTVVFGEELLGLLEDPSRRLEARGLGLQPAEDLLAVGVEVEARREVEAALQVRI